MNILSLYKRFSRLCYTKEVLKTNCQPTNDLSDPKSIVSWNIQGLFYYLNELKVQNIINSLLTLNVDVICLQEVFEDSLKEIIIKELSDIYPYFLLGDTAKKYILGEDSGILVLSKNNIELVKEVIFKDLIFPDNLSSKCILYFRVGNLNLCTTHLQSDSEITSRKQLNELSNKSPFTKFILTGDLNHTKAYEIMNCSKNNNVNTNDNKIVDYILSINDKKIYSSVIQMNIVNTSDHYPIKCILD